MLENGSAFAIDCSLPFQYLSLLFQPVSKAVHADLSHDQGGVSSDCLQFWKIGFKPFLRLQVYVEAHQIQEGQIEIFGGGIVNVRHQSIRVFPLDSLVQFVKKAFDLSSPMPSDHGGRDFIPNGVKQNSLMTSAFTNGSSHDFFDVREAAAFSEVSRVSFHRQSDHDIQAMFRRDIQQ